MKMYALGPKGTHGHEAAAKAAAWKHFALTDGKIDIELVDTHQEVLDLSDKHRCLGVVAIDNDKAGPVYEVVNRLASHPRSRTRVVAELTLPIRLDLLTHPDQDPRYIRSVVSHEKGLSQCAGNLAKREIFYTESAKSTAAAARDMYNARGDEGKAALASPFAAKLYGLKTVAANMQDSSNNKTTFYVFGPKFREYVRSKKSRTGIIFAVPDKPRSLLNALNDICCDGVNLHSMERIRLGSKRRSVFFVEFDAHRDSEDGRNIVRGLYRHVGKDPTGKPFLRVLGSWPVITR